ncbi:MAG: SbcC/MukB-like Walker B domain-containing protein [Spirochaetia bacterium]|jgi:chromosome condensin MukBEF ATPase and DNA-binding subunit MukB|nr:SbcC/MukB-like Walker B domain-containing protein [Spirochaetia bacterium]
MKGRIEQIAYIGWRGIDYEEVIQDREAFTGLIGPSGAGKSTLTMCLAYAQLPDRRVLDIHPISDLQDPHNAGKDTLLGRINPNYGYAYVVLDILTRHGTRLLAGIHAQGEDGRGEITRFYIDNYPEGAALQDAFRIQEGETQYYPDFPDLKRSLAARGYDLRVCAKVQDYGQVLYDAGVSPTNLADSSDRSLYSKLIETTFRGGISAEVATKLKDYLLPEERSVPDLVDKLEECTRQVFSTRRTLGDANKQLGVLQATYGTGKEIVSHALRHEIDNQTEAGKALEKLRQEIAEDVETLSQKKVAVEQLSEEIKTQEDTIVSLQESAKAELGIEEALMGIRADDERNKKSERDNARKLLNQFRNGEKAWRSAAESHANRDPDWLAEWLDKESDRLVREATKIELGIENLQEKRASLEGGSANPKNATLARSVGGRTLEEAFDDLDDQEARALEMGLCGMVDGVLGVSPNVLANLEISQDIPEIFWLGDQRPKEATVQSIGQWHVASTAGGYIVSSHDRRPTFGRKSREASIAKINEEIGRHLDHQRELRVQREGEDGKGGLKGRLSTLQINHDAIAFFIQNRHDALAIQEQVNKADNVYNEAVRLHGESLSKVTNLRDKLLQVAYSHQPALDDLKGKKTNAETAISKLNSELPGKQHKLAKSEEVIEEMNVGWAAILETLGNQSESFIADARQIEADEPGRYASQQTRRIISLGEALRDEPPARLETVQQAEPTNTLSCIRLWPMLLDMLRDRIVLDLADMDGADLLSEMQARRNDLNQKLGLQENEVRIQAKSLNSAIHSVVTSQRNRIRALSRLGENIHFGNIVGIRIAVDTHSKMLTMLEGFAEQMSLFSDNTTPVDQLLKEFFEKASEDYKFTGEELLDYRTYMDLRIEVMRQGGDWETASSLSGGESIGGGLAIALMLSRALAARGDIKAEQITPLFVIDEVHRLDPKGQGMIVELAKKEGFQVFVTASSLRPSYDCTLYTLERLYDPEERLIIRRQERNNASHV